MINFNLHILEYTNSNNVISSEQKWINLIKPEYNVKPRAGSSKGFKHSPESKEKIIEKATARKHTDIVITFMSIKHKAENNSLLGKKHSVTTIEKLKHIANIRNYTPVKGIEVEVTDLETKKILPRAAV